MYTGGYKQGIYRGGYIHEDIYMRIYTGDIYRMIYTRGYIQEDYVYRSIVNNLENFEDL